MVRFAESPCQLVLIHQLAVLFATFSAHRESMGCEGKLPLPSNERWFNQVNAAKTVVEADVCVESREISCWKNCDKIRGRAHEGRSNPTMVRPRPGATSLEERYHGFLTETSIAKRFHERNRWILVIFVQLAANSALSMDSCEYQKPIKRQVPPKRWPLSSRLG